MCNVFDSLEVEIQQNFYMTPILGFSHFHQTMESERDDIIRLYVLITNLIEKA